MRIENQKTWIPAYAGMTASLRIENEKTWIPAYAGMTVGYAPRLTKVID